MKELLWSLWGLIVVVALIALILWVNLSEAAPTPEKCSLKLSALAQRVVRSGQSGVVRIPHRCPSIYILVRGPDAPPTTEPPETARKCRMPDDAYVLYQGKAVRGYAKLFRERSP